MKERYFINNDEFSYNDFDDALKLYAKDEAKKDLDEHLDYIYRSMTTTYRTFYPSEVLKKLDPKSYNEEFEEYADSLYILYWNKLDSYGYCVINNVQFKIKK